MKDDIFRMIKETILKTDEEYNIEIDRIILFGSRARGDFKEESDLDLLIITKNEIDESKKIQLYLQC